MKYLKGSRQARRKLCEALESRRLLATISGTIMQDFDGDGVGNASVAGMVVWIDSNNDRLISSSEPQAQSIVDGSYTFGGLPAGTYTLRQVLIANWRQNVPAGSGGITVTVTASQVATGVNFLQTTANISGQSITGDVNFDDNRNGTKDTFDGSLNLQNLYLDLNNNSSLDANEPVRISFSTGRFAFEGLAAGTYTVRPMQVGEFVTTGTQSSTVTITASAGSNTTRFTFAPVSPTGGVGSGYVFNDTSQDGTRQTNELGLQGRTVWADVDNDGQIDTGEPSALTLLDGMYALRTLPAGTYPIRQAAVAGWSQTAPSVGAGRTVTISGSTIVSGQHFGSANTSGTLTGRVYFDTNDNGTFDNGDSVQSGRRVFVDANNDGVWQSATEQSTTTVTLGDWTLSALPAGTYLIRQVLDSGNRQTQPASNAGRTVTVAASQTISNLDFGQTYITPITEIDGVVFNDADNDGVKDAGEPGIGGRTVYIDANNNGSFDSLTERSATTFSSGFYSIAGMNGGTFTVRQVLPTDWTQTQPASNAPRTVTVALNGFASDVDFGSHFSDTTGPTISSQTFSFATAYDVAITFSEPLNPATVAASDLVAQNLVVNTNTSASSVTMNPTNTVATFRFNSLADGNYSFVIPQGAVADPAGNVSSAGGVLANQFVLAGDANRDRHVDSTDLSICQGNMGHSGATWSIGDFNRNGSVDSADEQIVLNNLRVWLPVQGSLSLSATSGSDQYRLVQSTINPNPLLTDICYQNLNGALYRLMHGAVTSLTFNGGQGNDLLWLDYSGGAPIPFATSITFDGGADTDELFIEAGTGADTGSSSAGIFVLNSRSIFHSNDEHLAFDGFGGWDNVTVAGGLPLSIANGQDLNSLVINSGSVSCVPGLDLRLNVRTLTVGANSVLDLTDNDLRVMSTSKSLIESYVRTACNGGGWNGPGGIFSSTAKNNGQLTTTIGILSGAEFNSRNGGQFHGATPAATDVLVKYTYYGDVNFDGFVDGLDYIFVDNGFLTHSTGWANGDVNYDGFVDGLDYIFIDNAFLAHGPQL